MFLSTNSIFLEKNLVHDRTLFVVKESIANKTPQKPRIYWSLNIIRLYKLELVQKIET